MSVSAWGVGEELPELPWPSYVSASAWTVSVLLPAWLWNHRALPLVMVEIQVRPVHLYSPLDRAPLGFPHERGAFVRRRRSPRMKGGPTRLKETS